MRAIRRPRPVVLMVKAGEATDAQIDELAPLLEPGDVIIDGGNARYQDTIRREQDLRARGLSAEYEVYQSWVHERWYDFFDRVALNPLVVPARSGPGRVRETYESQ